MIKDKIIIIEGANEGIKDELTTEEVVRAIFIKVLNMETLRIDKIYNYFPIFFENLIYEFYFIEIRMVVILL